MSEVQTAAPIDTGGSASKAWLRALELTASIPRNRNRVMPTLIEELAARYGDAPALLSDRECFTYRELAARSNRYARWALDQGIAKGDVVALLMTNRPEYLAIWLGITSIGGVVALLNTNLVGPSLSHCINIVGPRHLIVAAEFTGAEFADAEFADAGSIDAESADVGSADFRPADTLNSVLPALTVSPAIWIHGADHAQFRRIDHVVQRHSGEKLHREECLSPSIEDRALYIFTSGTTGLPKAANVSHARVLQWSLWFAGMMDARPADRMYNCLPMYHSIGGVLVPGATLLGGGSVVIREKFSASQFWSDVTRWDCTMFQYIGEFCRYLLHAAPSSSERNHRIRVACGNGLSPDVWQGFQDRFQIPRILEFYASTEGGVSLFNAEGKRGAIGRIPPYLAHRFAPALVRFDVDAGEPVRDAEGFCIRCAPNEPGEAIGKVVDDPSNIGSRFEGYTDERASGSKILRDVFAPGDVWIRTGDLMRKDEKGFFYFVDRVGDTFRWKGENVATSEVAEAISAFPAVMHATVYGVAIPGTEGRPGMAAVVPEGELDTAALSRHIAVRLPSYARPMFLRLQNKIEVTGTFKYSKTDLVRQGYDPSATSDPIYFHNPESGAWVRLDPALYERIQTGQIRL